jgi:hypothetical protein
MLMRKQLEPRAWCEASAREYDEQIAAARRALVTFQVLERVACDGSMVGVFSSSSKFKLCVD